MTTLLHHHHHHRQQLLNTELGQFLNRSYIAVQVHTSKCFL